MEQLVEAWNTGFEHETEVKAALDAAVILVDDYIGDVVVPDAILDLCYTRVASSLFEQSAVATNTGYEQEGAPTPVNRNPMNSVYHILRGYVLPW
ncbi:hypothetical protein [Rhodococcus wratislaviensis]|uniref:hypothetical protein n=1 Tax=Rhodococcus wratislaviensis TaxID=44752 RepID=UPI0011BDD5E5|nr:hypothetical protein [Rhodococcus wratislaviensis]